MKPGARLDSFTKAAVAVILVNALAWVWCSYGLAYLGRYEIAETLSERALEAVIGVFVTYAVKAFGENVCKYNRAQRGKKAAGSDLRRDY